MGGTFDVIGDATGQLLLRDVDEAEATAFAARWNEREEVFPIGVTAFVHQKCTNATQNTPGVQKRRVRRVVKMPSISRLLREKAGKIAEFLGPSSNIE